MWDRMKGEGSRWLIGSRSQLTAGSRVALLGVAAGLTLLCVWALAAAGADASNAKKAGVGAVYTQTNDPRRLTRSSSSTATANGTLLKRAGRPHGRQGQRCRASAAAPAARSSTRRTRSSSRGRRSGLRRQRGQRHRQLVPRDGRGLMLVDTGCLRRRHAGGPRRSTAACSTSSTSTPRTATGRRATSTACAYTATGQLTPDRGSSQPLANARPAEGTPGGAATARAIEFKPNGKVIVVTELAAASGGGPPGAIDTFVVGRQRQGEPAVSHPSSDGFPFGIAFNSNDHAGRVQPARPGGPRRSARCPPTRVNDSGRRDPDRHQVVERRPAVLGRDHRQRQVRVRGQHRRRSRRAGRAASALSASGMLNSAAPAAGVAAERVRPDRRGAEPRQQVPVRAVAAVGARRPARSHIDAYKVTATGGLTSHRPDPGRAPTSGSA